MEFGPEYAVIEQMNREAREGIKLYKRLADALTALDTWDLANEYLTARGSGLRQPRHRKIRQRGVPLRPKGVEA